MTVPVSPLPRRRWNVLEVANTMREPKAENIFRRTSRREFVRDLGRIGLTGWAAGSAARAAAQGASAVAEAQESGAARLMQGTGGALIVEQLKAAGVKYIFTTNTSGLETIMDALVDEREVNLILVSDEGQGVSATEGYALASRQLGFFIGSSVGVGNTISNLYNAWKDRTPMIVSFTRSPLKLHGGQDAFEEWDHHLQPAAPFSVWNWSCVDAQTMPETLRRGMRFAVTPPGGPVVMDFPEDLMRARIRAGVLDLDLAATRPAFRAQPDLVEKAAEWLAEAQNPLFVAGAEITRAGAERDFRQLAEKLAVPVCQAWPGEYYSAFPTDHPLFLSYYWNPMRFPANADLFINFGANLPARTPPPRGSRKVHISSELLSLERRDAQDELAIAAELRSAIRDLSAALDSRLARQRMEKVRRERWERVSAHTRAWRESRDLVLKARFNQSPLSWERVGYELEQALDPTAVVVQELGSEGDKLLAQMKLGGENKFRIGRTLGSALGWGMGAALGANLEFPERQIVALQGDGGFLFGQTETLWSIARYQAPMLIAILNNHSYNETRNRNMSFGGEQFRLRHDMTSYLGDPNVDFTKVAGAYGIRGEKIRNAGELTAAIREGLRSVRDGKPFLLDIEMARDGILSQSTWHPSFSIANLRRGGRGEGGA
jgi:acetolactate synthase I/II/III large subunit